jgi:RimJ/RimL family protein N-acetyltransferase
MNTPIITTGRTWLTEVEHTDVEAFLPLFSDPAAMKYFPEVMDKKKVAEWIDMVRGFYAEQGYCFYKMVRKSDDAVLGYCGPILQKDVDGVDEIEIGYALIPAYWKQGYAAEAARASINYAFDALKAPRIISLIRPENAPSVRVAENCGLRFEKDVDRWGHTHGVYVRDRKI